MADPPVQLPPPPPPAPSAQDISNARVSGLNALLNSDSNNLVLSWADTFSDETGYRIERRSTSGAWEVVESLPATPGVTAPYTWQRIIDHPATYRVVAQKNDYSVPLEVDIGVSEIPVELASGSLALLVSMPDPVHGTAQLTIEGASSALAVRYFVDLESLNSSSSRPSFPVSWDTKAVTEGAHLLLARVQLRAGLFMELRRPVVVDNPKVAVALSTSGSSGVLTLNAIATSEAGIQSVEFFLNGTSIGVSTTASSGQSWLHQLDTRGMPAGVAVVRALATDNNGDRADASLEISIDNAPVVGVVTPIDGAIVSGALELRGTLTDDQPGATLTAWLGDVQIFQSGQSQFATTYSLAGLPAGQYTLTITGRDSAGHAVTTRRAVIVASAAGFNHELVGSYGANVSLLDTDAGRLLFRSSDNSVHLRGASGSDVSLEQAAEIIPPAFVDSREDHLWSLGGDYVTTFGYLSGTAATRVFLFDASGHRTEVPGSVGSDGFIRSGLHGPWLVWGAGQIHLENLSTHSQIDVPVLATAILLRGHALVTTPGSEQLFFSRETGQQQASAIIDLFSFNLTNQTVTQLSGGVGRSFRPRTDNARVAWERAQPNQDVFAPPFELAVAPVANPTSATVRSSSMISFDLRDGLLAWVENQSGAQALKVDDGVQTETLSLTTATTLYSTANGNVLFGESGKLYVWSKSHGRRLLLDVLPQQILQRDGVVFFSLGASNLAIYRTLL